MSELLLIIGFVVGFVAVVWWKDRQEDKRFWKNIEGLIFSSKDHETKGKMVCKKCQRKYVDTLIYNTMDMVMTKDGDAYWYRCPHCWHTWSELI